MKQLLTGKKSLLVDKRGLPMAGVVAAAPAVDWWLAGDIDPSAVIAVYLAKGAASYAASKVNLANPATHALTEGTGGAVAWDAATGWTFANDATKVLKTDIVPVVGYTFIAQFADAVSGTLFGSNSVSGGGMCGIWPSGVSYRLGAESIRSPALGSGNLAIAGRTPYRNGSVDGADTTGTALWTGVPLYIGASDLGSFMAVDQFSGKIYAVAIYNTTLTAAQVLAVATEMTSF